MRSPVWSLFLSSKKTPTPCVLAGISKSDIQAAQDSNRTEKRNEQHNNQNYDWVTADSNITSKIRQP